MRYSYTKDYQYIDHGPDDDFNVISGILTEGDINKLAFFAYDGEQNKLFLMKTSSISLRYKLLPTTISVNRLENTIYGIYNTIPTTFYLMSEIFYTKMEIKDDNVSENNDLKIIDLEHEYKILRGSLYINNTLIPGTYKTNLHFSTNAKYEYESLFSLGILNYTDIITNKTGGIKNIKVKKDCIIKIHDIKAIAEYYTISANSYNNYYNNYGLKVAGINNLHVGDALKTNFMDPNMLMIPAITSPSYIMKPVGLSIDDFKNTQLFKNGSLDYFNKTETAFIYNMSHTEALTGIDMSKPYRVDIPILQFSVASFMERLTEVGSSLSPTIVSPTVPVMMGSLEATYTNSFNQTSVIGFNNICPNPGANNTPLTIKTIYNKIAYTIPTIPVFTLNIGYLPFIGILNEDFYLNVDNDWTISKVSDTIKKPLTKFDISGNGYFLDDDPFFRYDNNLIDGFLMIGRKYSYDIVYDGNYTYLKRTLLNNDLITLNYKNKSTNLPENDVITKLKNGEIRSGVANKGSYSAVGYPINGLLNPYNQNSLKVREDELNKKLRWGPYTLAGKNSDSQTEVMDIYPKIFNSSNKYIYSLTTEPFCFGKINDVIIMKIVETCLKKITGKYNKNVNKIDIVVPIISLANYVNNYNEEESFIKIEKSLTIFKPYSSLFRNRHIFEQVDKTDGILMIIQYIKIETDDIDINIGNNQISDKNYISKVELSIGNEIKLTVNYKIVDSYGKEKEQKAEFILKNMYDTEHVYADVININYNGDYKFTPNIITKGSLVKMHTLKNINYIDLSLMDKLYKTNDNKIKFIKSYKLKKLDDYYLYKLNLIELKENISDNFMEETDPDITIDLNSIQIEYFNKIKELQALYTKLKDRLPTLITFE